MTTEIQRIARRQESVESLFAELRIRAAASSLHRPDPHIVSAEREQAYNFLSRSQRQHNTLSSLLRDVDWLVIGEAALANYGSSFVPRHAQILVPVHGKTKVDWKFSLHRYSKVGGGEASGYKFDDWRGLRVVYWHQNELPEPAGNCAGTRDWPVCEHGFAIAWALKEGSKQSIANIIDVIVGGLDIDWSRVEYWLKLLSSDSRVDNLLEIQRSIIENKKAWDVVV